MSTEAAQLEAMLFSSGAPVSKKRLAESMGCDVGHLDSVIAELRDMRKESGIVVVDSGSHAALMTHPSSQECVEHLRNEEQYTPLSRVSQETLAIIAYLGPVSKIDIDFLRGVNTHYTLRRLSVRGLIREHREHRMRLVSVTVEFLSHLGLESVAQLPDYAGIRRSLLDGISAVKKRTEEQGS